MLRKTLFETLILLTFAVVGFAHGDDIRPEPSPTPASSGSATAAQIAQLEEEIKLMQKQQAYEQAKFNLANQRMSEIMNALPKSSTAKVPAGDTTFKDQANASPETAALSYGALTEVSATVAAAIRKITSEYDGYAGFVIHNEDDFKALARYRFYKNQLETTLRNYRELRADAAALRKELGLPATPTSPVGDDGAMSIDGATAAIQLPAMGTGILRSVADLISLFQTDTTIEVGKVTMDDQAVGTAMADALMQSNPRLEIFFPKAFVSEYDVEAEVKDSLAVQIIEINTADAIVGKFLIDCKFLNSEDQKKDGVKKIIADATIVKSQLAALAIGEDSSQKGPQSAGGGNDPSKLGWNDVRSMFRAEKLDRFLLQGKSSLGSAGPPYVGILKLRTLAAGGSRLDSRNLFTGNKVRYSGSVTLEVLLFDVNGRLKMSKIFSLQTGFRKLKTLDE